MFSAISIVKAYSKLFFYFGVCGVACEVYGGDVNWASAYVYSDKPAFVAGSGNEDLSWGSYKPCKLEKSCRPVLIVC